MDKRTGREVHRVFPDTDCNQWITAGIHSALSEVSLTSTNVFHERRGGRGDLNKITCGLAIARRLGQLPGGRPAFGPT